MLLWKYEKTNMHSHNMSFNYKICHWSHVENEMQKLGANQRLKSGIFCVLECGICTGRIWNPALGIWNPQCGIQNLILSWSTLHGV